jgi:membrane protein DedA with SNARE-associated domain
MLDLSTSGILELLTQYGYAIIFPISIIEGPMVAALAGFLVSVGRLNAVLVFLLLLLGDMIGDTLYYCLGYFFRRGKVPKWLGYIGIKDHNVHVFEHYFQKHDWKIILLGKTQAVGVVILFSAGFARMSYKKFMAYNVLGSTPKIILFEGIGFYFGESYKQLDSYFNYAAIASMALALALLGGYFLFKRYLKTHYEELKVE